MDSSHRSVIASNLSPGLRKSNSTSTRRAPSVNTSAPQAASTGNHPPGDSIGIPQRSRSLRARFPGDMSHRPLDIIKQDFRAADRGSHRRSRRGRGSGQHQQKCPPDADPIDVLDKAPVGGPYHHDGPYDATLASRNLNPELSPVEAVKASNMEAIKATPRDFIQDSLQKHVPLQGTATVASGERDLGGRLMEYDEGADLMREEDAPGGAYGRWPGQVRAPQLTISPVFPC
jgi:hypothetical protein